MTAALDTTMPAGQQLPDLVLFEEHYGIKVSGVGEDGDLVALGHHDLRRVVAAFNRYSRKSLRLDGVWDDRCTTYVEVVLAITTAYAALAGECGECGPGASYVCDRCETVRGGGWWLTWDVGADHPDRFPATFLAS